MSLITIHQCEELTVDTKLPNGTYLLLEATGEDFWRFRKVIKTSGAIEVDTSISKIQGEDGFLEHFAYQVKRLASGNARKLVLILHERNVYDLHLKLTSQLGDLETRLNMEIHRTTSFPA